MKTLINNPYTPYPIDLDTQIDSGSSYQVDGFLVVYLDDVGRISYLRDDNGKIADRVRSLELKTKLAVKENGVYKFYDYVREEE